MRIFTVVFIYILQERQNGYFNLRTGDLLFIYHSGLDFTQYT